LPPNLIASVIQATEAANIRDHMQRLHGVRRYVVVDNASDDAVTGRLLNPLPHTSTPSELQFVVSTAQRRLSAKADELEVEFSFGKSGDFDYELPPWPDVPQQRLDRAPVQQLFSLAGGLFAFFQEQAKKTKLDAISSEIGGWSKSATTDGE
jgi:hypothetical protein